MRDVIIIPTYNERENIKNLLRTISSLLPNVHILVVDDNSPDHTSYAVRQVQAEISNVELLLRAKKEGLGKAYVAAFKKVLSEGNVRSVCTMDADFSHNARYLKEIFSDVQKYDVVVGSRYVGGGGMNSYSFLRRIISLLATYYCRMFFRLEILDYTSGFMCIKTQLLSKIDLEKVGSSGFAFLIELKYLLWERGGKFKEFPITMENRREGESKMGIQVILECVLLPWRLIFKSYLRIIKNFLVVTRDALSKRGVFFLVRHGPEVLYRSYFKKNIGFFTFQNKKYQYFHHLYNSTCINERAVEIPITWEIVQKYQEGRILEVGNVLSHYFPCRHDVLDKYEKGDGVINQDVVDFRPSEKYDLIVSISTLEHVGFDEELKDPQKILFAIENLRRILAEGGKMVITLCLGYNFAMDKLLESGALKFTKLYFLKRVSGSNEWKEVNQNELGCVAYDYSGRTANGLVMGIIEK
jgi:dolichol-phosphate mannosyltransferase